MTTPTRVPVGQLQTGQQARLANRKGTSIADGWIEVADVKPVVDGKTRKYRVYRAGGTLYGYNFGPRTVFEVRAPQAPEPEPPTTEPTTEPPTGRRPKPTLPSKSQTAALGRLAAAEGQRLTRRELHADPMVVVALERKDLVTVDRTGNVRADDPIELTDAGRAVQP